jgi:serine/threonine protein kinase
VSRILIPHAAVCHMEANTFVRSEFSSKDLKNVGNYTLGRLIGKGSFGKVYLATHKLTNGSKVRNTGQSRLVCYAVALMHRAGSTQIGEEG